MSQQSFEVAFFTIGEFAVLSDDDTVRTAHIDIPAEALPIAATLQSARQWLHEQHAHVDMECAAEIGLRGYFAFKSAQGSDGFNVESAQLVCLDEGFVVRAALDNGISVETDVMALAL